MTGNGHLDSRSEAKFWLREVEEVVKLTKGEGEREGFLVPPNFACDARWLKVEEEIGEAVANGDYIKTRDLCRNYATRAVRYCRAWLENNRAKGVAAR